MIQVLRGQIIIFVYGHYRFQHKHLTPTEKGLVHFHWLIIIVVSITQWNVGC